MIYNEMLSSKFCTPIPSYKCLSCTVKNLCKTQVEDGIDILRDGSNLDKWNRLKLHLRDSPQNIVYARILEKMKEIETKESEKKAIRDAKSWYYRIFERN